MLATLAMSPDWRARLVVMLDEAERFGIHGLAFQHIVLCPTRAWLHHHRLDCAHLNRHMQLGLLLHESAYSGLRQHFFGIAPDRVDWARREVSEVKKSRSHEAALVSQLVFYLAALTVATGEDWRGVLRYPSSRRTRAIMFDEAAAGEVLERYTAIRAVIDQPTPPPKERRSLCPGCSYRLLCWGEATEDTDA